MERGNTELARTPERTPAQTSKNLGQAALLQTEAARATERSRALGQKALATAVRPISPVLDINRFNTPALAELYPPREINADRRYVQDRKQHFSEAERTHIYAQAKNFEMMFLYGVQRNAWLGNTLNVFGQPPFTTDTSAATEYDDYLHRIDAFTTLQFTNSRPNETHQASVSRVVLGFDATISGNYQTILKKITRCHNDPNAQLPFGFSQIKYYVNGRNASKQPLVPRYTIGISAGAARDLRQMATIKRQNGKIIDMSFNNGQSAFTRFMILSEIRAQNELYQAMLPDQLDTPLLKKADMSLSLISEQLNTALDQCIDRLTYMKWLMGDRKVSPPDVRTPEEREDLRQFVLQGVLKRCEQDFIEQKKEDAQRKNGGYLPRNYRPNPDSSDPFVQIMRCCQELTAAAKAGQLDAHRTVSAHTKVFKAPGHQ